MSQVQVHLNWSHDVFKAPLMTHSHAWGYNLFQLYTFAGSRTDVVGVIVGGMKGFWEVGFFERMGSVGSYYSY